MKSGIAALLTVALAGCASAMTWYAGAPTRVVPCSSAADCDAAWSRVQAAITETGTFRVRAASDSIIETYGPQQYVSHPAFQAVRQKNADGSGQVRITALCAVTIYGCAYELDVELGAVYFKALLGSSK